VRTKAHMGVRRVEVRIHNLRNVAPSYRELLALLAYLAWLLHWFPSSNPFCSVHSFAKRFTTLHEVLYVHSCSSTRVCMGELVAKAA
jgi:hypothetical protein